MEPVSFLDQIAKLLPMVAAVATALGLWHLVAALVRKFWDSVKSKVLKSPTKLDDEVIKILSPGVDALIKLIDEGKAEDVKKQLLALKALAPKTR